MSFPTLPGGRKGLHKAADWQPSVLIDHEVTFWFIVQVASRGPSGVFRQMVSPTVAR